MDEERFRRIVERVNLAVERSRLLAERSRARVQHSLETAAKSGELVERGREKGISGWKNRAEKAAGFEISNPQADHPPSWRERMARSNILDHLWALALPIEIWAGAKPFSVPQHGPTFCGTPPCG